MFRFSLELNHLDDLQYRNLNSTLLSISEVDLCGGTINMRSGVKKKNEVMTVKVVNFRFNSFWEEIQDHGIQWEITSSLSCCVSCKLTPECCIG